MIARAGFPHVFVSPTTREQETERDKFRMWINLRPPKHGKFTSRTKPTEEVASIMISAVPVRASQSSTAVSALLLNLPHQKETQPKWWGKPRSLGKCDRG